MTNPSNSRKHNDTSVVLYSFVIALAACNFGFSQSTTGGFLAMPAFQAQFGTYNAATGTTMMLAGRQTLMYGLEVSFITCGSLLAGLIATRYGRKSGLYFCAIASIAGLLTQMASNYTALVVGRSIMGVGIGLAAAFSIPYWSEIAPPRLRGVIVLLYQFSINISNFIGSCVDQGTHELMTTWAYRIPLLIALVVPITIMCILWIVPESPRWLITTGEVDKAKANLQKLRGPTYTEAEVQFEIDDCIRFTQLEAAHKKSSSYAECFKGTNLRRTLVACLMTGGQQCMGTAFLAGYATYFFGLVGTSDPFISSVIANGMAVAGSFAAFPLIKYVPRRAVMVTGAIVSGLCMLLFAIVAELAPGSKTAGRFIVACICVFNFSYSASWGPIGPIVMGEVPSNTLRSKTVAIAAAVGFLGALIVITSVPYLIGAQYANLGTRVGFIFGGLTTIITVVTWLCLPETKDRPLEEIDEMFMKRVLARQFRTFRCTSSVPQDVVLVKQHAGKLEQSHFEHCQV